MAMSELNAEIREAIECLLAITSQDIGPELAMGGFPTVLERRELRWVRSYRPVGAHLKIKRGMTSRH